jgi:DNA-binding IclR family transcriptional regulator
MARADSKLYALLADEACYAILRALLLSDKPMTQAGLTATLPFNSSTISRRMGELEDAGLVARATSHAPYTLLFHSEIHALLLAGAGLAETAHRALADDVEWAARPLRADGRGAQSPIDQVEGPG